MPRLLRAVPMLAWMAVLFMLSHQPGNSLAVPLFPGDDKVAHLIAYSVLAASILFAFPPRARQQHPWTVCAGIVLLTAIFAITDEYHQSFIPSRDPSIWDFFADCLGAVLVCTWYRIRKRAREKTASR